MVDNWELMEKYWHRSIYSYLRCQPEDHYFILTEPPMNTPENREQMAEIMFETFGVAGLYIGVQAVLALYAGVAANNQAQAIKPNQLTGAVIDSGDGVTHVIPVVYNIYIYIYNIYIHIVRWICNRELHKACPSSRPRNDNLHQEDVERPRRESDG